MAQPDDEHDDRKDRDGPSLELPSFGFRRRRRAEADEQPAPGPVRAAPPTAAPAPPAPVDRPTPGTPVERTRPRPALPQVRAVPASLVTGVVVGLVTVGLVWASQRGCELVRGTSSCGRAGFLVLLAVLVAAGLLGGALLRAFGAPEGGSTSFLAMSLVAVLLMLVLGDQLFAWWMVLAVPAVAAVSYLLAHRVTTAMVPPVGREMHR